VDRAAGEIGVCGVGALARVASVGPHFGEERPLSGLHGSGTVFFAGCNLGCVFCQNSDLSHEVRGREVTREGLAASFLSVQEMGCHNLNLVTPTHVTPQIVEALEIARMGGFALKVVWNCGGYESLETLSALDGLVDIYMPDIKTLDEGVARKLLGASDYPEVVRAAVREMHRQVGDLEVDDRGVAVRGLLVRHLALPRNQATTAEVARFIAGVSTNTYFNLMDQYRPCHEAHLHSDLDRILTQQEWRDAREAVLDAGLTRLD
jgi:putative pyruvate formate lyase activating enzyme